MGYRNYIGYISKREYNKIKSLNQKQLSQFYNVEEDDCYRGFVKELYEYGKYVEFQPPKKSFKPFFKNKELQKQYNEDQELYAVTDEFFAYTIDSYKEIIQTYYIKMLAPFREDHAILSLYNKDYDLSELSLEQKNAVLKMIQHVNSMSMEWLALTPYDLHNDTSEINSSWKYEYAIFELVRIYKTFDWKRNVLVYYGY
jgi:hypothetical protein